MQKKPFKLQPTQKEKYLQQLAMLEDKWKTVVDVDNEDAYPDSSIPIDRTEALEPEPLDKSKYNPDGIVDIITFVEHPYYLGLKLHPWQKLILKLFYMGSEGNSILKINDVEDDQRAAGCSGCVWNDYRMDEMQFYKKRQQGVMHRTRLLPQNSPCLTCNRFDPNARQAKYESLMEQASTVDAETQAQELQDRELCNNYETEADLLSTFELNEVVREQIKNKLGRKFEELVLVIGRRGSKSLLTSTMALYELHKLIKMGHPQKKYMLLEFDEIYILNVATNEDTAKTAIFSKIKNTALSSPFFNPYRGAVLELEMRFLTQHDLDENQRREANGLKLLTGSLIMKCGTSNAAGLVGKTCWCIIMDEIAAMAGENPDSGIDYRLYDDLKPSLATFGADGKMIMLSQPKGPVGLLYDLYTTRMSDDTTLVMQLPTWVVNPSIDLHWLAKQKAKDPKEYLMQYGAEFGSVSEEPFLPSEFVERAFSNSNQLTRTVNPVKYHEYYCHVDPARTSDYYALTIVHAEPMRTVNAAGRPLKQIIVDYIHYWAPVNKNLPVSPEAIELHIIKLHELFKFKQVSFDQWHSQAAIVNLKNQGVPAVLRVFNREYKDKIYGNLFDLFNNNLIHFYQISGGINVNSKGENVFIQEIEEAKTQLTYLQKKFRGNKYIICALHGYKDDIPDCVAAASYEALQTIMVDQLPRGRVFNSYGRIR